MPQDKDMRSKALTTMDQNYAAARITLVHDLYLREWEWVDAGTACFAIVMSPWFSRGWTALELARSHKVKILFKSKNDGYLIKDLDIDILDKVSELSVHHETANVIRKLRCVSVQTFGDLLSILGPRDTSKPRDVAIIAGLLAGVDTSGGLSQQEIYQRILRKLGKVAQGHLFHSSATMTAPGFNWCPTNILDMPMVEVNSEPPMLQLAENGELEGTWMAYSIDNIEDGDIIWQKTHPLTVVSLKSALSGPKRSQYILLAEDIEAPSYRALLVRPMECKRQFATELYCSYVGPVYLHLALGSRTAEKQRCKVNARIGNDDQMENVYNGPWNGAWEYVCEAGQKSSADGHELRGDRCEVTQTTVDEDDYTIQTAQRDWANSDGLIFLASDQDGRKEQLDEACDAVRGSQDVVSLTCVLSEPPVAIAAFFYGSTKLIPEIQHPPRGSEMRTGIMLLLSLVAGDGGMKPRFSACQGSRREARLLNKALLRAVQDGSGALVAFLLDKGALHTADENGDFPLHAAIRNKSLEVVKSLLGHPKTAANPNLRNAEKQTALQLVDLSARRDGSWNKESWIQLAALIMKYIDKTRLSAEAYQNIGAADEGRQKSAEVLIKGGLTGVHGSSGNTILHYAAQYGLDEYIQKHLAYAKRGDSSTGCNSEGSDDGEQPLYVGAATPKSDRNSEGETPLHIAAKYNNTRCLEALLKHTDVICGDNQDHTPLQVAAKHGHLPAVKTLLQWRAGRYTRDQPDGELDLALYLALDNFKKYKHHDRGDAIEALIDSGARLGDVKSQRRTCLHLVILAQCEKQAERLLESVVFRHEALDKRDENMNQQSPLLLAARFGMSKVVQSLLDKEADITSTDKMGRTALHWAAVCRNGAIVNILLRKDDSNIDQKDSNGATPLHLAAREGGSEEVKLLLSHNANLDARDNRGRSALIIAVANGWKRVAQTLLFGARKPDRMLVDKSGMRALDWAALGGHSAIVKLFIDNPKPNAKLENDRSHDEACHKALGVAVGARRVGVSTMLYAFIKDRKLRDSAAASILFEAAKYGPYGLIVYLISMGHDINCQDKTGQTILMLILKARTPDLCWLLERGADPNIQDHNTHTALMMASERRCCEYVKQLLGAKADPNIQDARGRTALHYAILGARSLTTASHYPFDSTRDASEYVQDPNSKSIIRTAKSDFVATLLHLLRAGARRDVQDQNGRTPLHLAMLEKLPLDEIDSIFSTLLNDSITGLVSLDTQDAEGRTALLLAVENDRFSVARRLLAYSQCNPDIQDLNGRTPLLVAAERGDAHLTTILLIKKANRSLADKSFRTPLQRAAENGHSSVVSLLTGNIFEEKSEEKHGGDLLNLNTCDGLGRTALMLAAENGHEDIVDCLKRFGADPNLTDNDGKKAWQRAMERGHSSIVDVLLCDAEAPDREMIALNEALLLAARRGWASIVKVLLQNEAVADFKDNEGRMALHMAATGGHYEVVKMLLEKGKGVDISAEDNQRRTAVLRATECGFESIVELLLSSSPTKDGIGSDALLCAAEKGNRSIVSHLADRNVNLDSVNSARRTALALAASNGNLEIVDFLLERKANPNISDGQNRTPLHHAAWGGHDEVVRSLLKWQANAKAVDYGGQSALHLAAERASTSAVKLLLDNGANPSAKALDGRTALHCAAWGRAHDVVKLLIERGAEPSVIDSSNNRPWQVAAEKGYEEIVETLLKNEQSLQDDTIDKRRGLLFASQNGYAALAEALLNRGAEPTIKDQKGLTPLHWAARRGDNIMVDRLVTRQGSIETLNSYDSQRCTPLCLAVEWNWPRVVQLLLEKGADPNIPGVRRQTVIHMAAENGNFEMVQILIKGKADPHARDDQGQKAWLLAAKAGHHQIAGLLLEREVGFNPQGPKIGELLVKMAGEGSVPMVRLLLDKGVDKDTTDHSGQAPLASAAERGKDRVVHLLLRRGANPAIFDSNRRTPLFWAARTGNLRVTELLVDAITGRLSPDQVSPPSMDPHYPDAMPKPWASTGSSEDILNYTDSLGRTALLTAVLKKHEAVALLLLSKGQGFGINPSLKDTKGTTALQVAVENGSNELVAALLNNGADRAGQDMLGRTPLILASMRNQHIIADTLLTHENTTNIAPDMMGPLEQTDQRAPWGQRNRTVADFALDRTDLRGRTALHVATEQGNQVMAEFLIKKGISINKKDNQGQTALFLAAESAAQEILDLLLQHGARQDLCDNRGRTPLMVAVANGDLAIVQALLAHDNADITTTDEHGRSLIDLATDSGSKDVAWQLMQFKGARRMRTAIFRTY